MILFSFFGSLMLAGHCGLSCSNAGAGRITGSSLGPDLLWRGADPFFLRSLFNLSFGSPGVDAIIGSSAALILIPTESPIAASRRTAAADTRRFAACCNAAVALGGAAIYRLREAQRNIISRVPPMSFRIQPQPVARPNRCQLFGPGSRPAIFEKMASVRGGRDQPRPRGLRRAR
jgi:hypothetical protein